MNYYLIDQNNQVIEISQNVVNKSRVLSEFFKKHPQKAYNLFYPKIIIDQMIQNQDQDQGQGLGLCQSQSQSQRQSIDFKNNNNNMLYKLYQELDIKIDDNNITNKSNQFDIKSYATGQALHIFNSIHFKGNNFAHKTYTELRQPAHHNYIVTVPCKKRLFSVIKDKIKSVITNMIYINEEEEHSLTLSKNDFKNSYSVLNDKQCIRNDFIGKIINNKMMCNDRKFRQLVDISWNYEIIETIPEMQIVVDQFDIGSLINGDALGIQLNADIFDIVVELLIKRLKKDTNTFCGDNECHQLRFNKYNQIIEIHKDYFSYIVKIKRIYVNYNSTYF